MKVEQGQNIFLNFPFSNGSGAGGRVAGWQGGRNQIRAFRLTPFLLTPLRFADRRSINNPPLWHFVTIPRHPTPSR